MTKIPCVVYAARSQAEEAGKDSTGDQLAIIRTRVEREGGRVVVGEYADHASGYRGDRGPHLKAAMVEAVELATAHETVELWVWISSRLARGSGRKGEARSVLEVFAHLRRNGVTLRSVEDDQFVTSPMLVGFAAEQAEKYSRDLAANVRRGIDANVRAGKPWGEPGLGYTKGDDGHWTIVPEEAAAVRRAFAEYIERVPSYSGVARALNAAGFRPRRSSRWSPTVVRRTLTSRHVLGEFHHAGAWHPGSHGPIVDVETWEAAQALAEQGAKYAPGGRSGRLPKAHVFVRGMLRCGLCGEAMLPRSDEGRETYICRSRKVWATCSMPVLRRDVVEAAALALFEERAFDYEATRAHVAAQLDSGAADALEQAARAAREASDARSALARFDRDYAAGVLSGDNYQRLTAKFGAELEAAESEVGRLRAHAAELTDRLEHLDAESETLRRLTELRAAVSARISDASSQDVTALRAALAAVFDHIEIEPDASGAPRFTVLPVVRPSMSGAIRLRPHRAAIAFDMTPKDGPDNSMGSGVPL